MCHRQVSSHLFILRFLLWCHKNSKIVQYRGKNSEPFARALHKLNAPCTVVKMLRKLKTVLPSLKPRVPFVLRSRIVYKIKCPHCKVSYVGMTTRHVLTRFREHKISWSFKKGSGILECLCKQESNFEPFQLLLLLNHYESCMS